METRAELMVELCERAGVRGRRREVLVRLAEGKSPTEVGAELGMAVATVYVHKHAGWKRVAAQRERQAEVELLRFLLHEAIPGPVPADPKPALYRSLPGGGGERVRLHAEVVTVEDLVPPRH